MTRFMGAMVQMISEVLIAPCVDMKVVKKVNEKVKKVRKVRG
jgi:hypothetical protein